MMHQIVLAMDTPDYKAIYDAIKMRENFKDERGYVILPPGDGNWNGRVIAEICRGWMEMLELSKRKGVPYEPLGPIDSGADT